ncbi:MAG: nucleotidyltransferase family protein [Actinomycetota bacterium]
MQSRREDLPQTLARRIASFGMPGAPAPETVSFSDQRWEKLFALVRFERITGLALESVAHGWLDLTDEQTDRLYTAHRDAMTWSLLLERKLVALAEAFDRDVVGFAVLKGASVARTVYPEPCLRSFGDVDVLVRSVDYGRACALLERLGHVRQRPEPRPGFEVRFGKGSVHRHPDDAIEVDLHRTLVLGPFGLWIDPEELLDRSTTFELGGRIVGRLDDTAMLLNVAMHASLGRSEARLVPLRDVAQVAERGLIDWGTLSDWARRWHVTSVLQDAFSTALLTLGAPVPVEARRLMASEPPKSEVRALQAYKGQRRSLGGTSLTTLRAIPGLGNKATYVWDLAVPDRAFLEARENGNGTATYRRRWSIAVRWASARLSTRRST